MIKGFTRDFTGQKIGHLHIDGFSHKSSTSGGVWLATCKCGNKANVYSRTLRRAIEKKYFISCGKCEYATRKVNVTFDEAAFNFLYSLYKHGSRRRHFEFRLTPEKFREFTSKNCHYCGIGPKQISRSNDDERKGIYLYNGLDRLDPSKGYVVENVVSSCGECNIMKQTLGEKEFINKCAKILKHQLSKACPSFNVQEWLREIGL